jgi:hypothetical protein
LFQGAHQEPPEVATLCPLLAEGAEPELKPLLLVFSVFLVPVVLVLVVLVLVVLGVVVLGLVAT